MTCGGFCFLDETRSNAVYDERRRAKVISLETVGIYMTKRSRPITVRISKG